MKISQVLHYVMLIVFGEAAGENLELITLGSEGINVNLRAKITEQAKTRRE